MKADEEKIAVQIQIHYGDDKLKLENYWSKITDIPKRRFNKTIVRPAGHKPGKSLGTCKVRFSDKATYLQLEKMLVKELSAIGITNHGIETSSRSSNLLE